MKPLKIHMKNIGPFIDEELDFTELDEVFLLCGDTGAGKTTIFDAMTFALYGEFLGARKGKSKDFRSQFASDGDESLVEFEFSSGGEKFRVARTLPYNYINRNGKLSQKDSMVSLEIWNDGCGRYENINAGKTEINSRIEQTTGLRADEFSKIVVLPQGEFSEFLRANSKEKQELLQKLFPVEFYQSIVEKVKEENDSVQEKLKVLESSIGELSKDVDFTDAEKKISSLEASHKEKKEYLEKLRGEKEELAKKYTVIETELKTAKELERAEEEKKKLDEESESIGSLVEKLAKADEADAVVPFIEGKNSRLEEEKDALEYYENNAADVKDAQEKYDGLKKKEEENSKLEKILESNRLLLKTYSDRLVAAEKHAKVLTESKTAHENRVKLKKSLSDLEKKEKDKIQRLKEIASTAGIDCSDSDVSGIHSKILEKFSEAKEKASEAARIYNTVCEASQVQEKIESTEKNLASLEEEKKTRSRQIENIERLLLECKQKKEEQIANNTACTLVPLLKPGCACPVCGSTEHPSPAKASGDFLDLDEKIETAVHSLESEKDLIASCCEKMAASKEILEKYREDLLRLKKETGDVSVEEAFERSGIRKDEMYSLQDASDKSGALLREIQDSKKDMASLKDEIGDAESECSSLETALKLLEEQITKSGDGKTDADDIRKDMDDLSLEVEKQQGQVEKFRVEFENADRYLGKCRTRLEESVNSLEAARKNSKEALATLEKKFAQSKFRSEKEAMDCFVEKNVRMELKKTVDEFRREYERVDAAIDLLSKKVSEKPAAIEKKTGEISARMEEMQKSIDDATGEAEEIFMMLTRLEKDFMQFKKLSDSHGKLASKAEPLARLWKDLSGGNPSRIRFESWFLGLYFDDVVVCANRHLLKISGQRYEFKMDTEKTGGNSLHGLDLVVHDYRTNNDRDTATLSGGETFMASISLALGLTEVVQKSSRLDSLFIDEGFGSLDKESLEMALGVLQEIGNSRTVGIISHVEEMLGAIPCHVEVKKTAHGSHISACC